MQLSTLEAFLRRHQRVSILAGLLLVFAGVDLLLNPPKGRNIELFGVPFLVTGLVLFAFLFRRIPGAPVPEARGTLASRFLHLVTLRGNLVRWFPAVAIVL